MTAPQGPSLPPSVLRWLGELPTDLPVAMLVRHAARPWLEPGDVGYMLPITDDGARAAAALGRLLGPRLRTLHTSPLPRCVQTAEAIREGAARDLAIHRSRWLGDPGVFVVDDRVAGEQWATRGQEAMMEHLMGGDEALPGWAPPEQAAWALVRHMLVIGDEVPGVHAFVTHDSLVLGTAARILGKRWGRDAWPAYLEGAFFWYEGGALHGAYRELRRVVGLGAGGSR